MPLSPEQIDRLARLCRIALEPEEGAAVREQLNRVLGLVDQMRAVDTSGVAPMAHAVGGEDVDRQRLRADAVTEGDRRAKYQAVAPAVEEGLYLVPRVIE